MFAVRRIFRSRKTLTNYICTSNVVKCEESKKSNNAPDQPKKKNNLDFMKVAKSEKKRKVNLSTSTSTTENETEKSESVKVAKPKRKSQKLKQVPESEPKGDIFRKILVSSVESVAKDLGGDRKETKKDLLAYIKTFEVLKEKPEEKLKETENIKKQPVTITAFKNFRSTNIFNPQIMKTDAEQVKLNIWDDLESEDLNYLSKKSPRNHFEELIQWTNEGKLWKFPIDNDQGLEAEARVSFTEHIFLERHLEPWCPKKGPLRKFMELVLIGLSKNPYLSVEDKKEHIKWFQDYFESKKKLLQELGAAGTTKEINPPSSNP